MAGQKELMDSSDRKTQSVKNLLETPRSTHIGQQNSQKRKKQRGKKEKKTALEIIRNISEV